MSVDEDGAGRGEGWFVRAAGVVGDLGNPFYREERQRDVWNEASAVGFQLVLWLGTASAAAMVWLGGAPAVPYAVALYALLGAAAGTTVLYAARLGVTVDDARRMLRLRLLPYLLLLVAFLTGVVRVAPADGFGAGFAWGALLGAAVATAWLVLTGLRARRAERRSPA